jgi:hypothetical protein
MGTHAADDADELVVAPELAEVAERLGVPLHVGDRVRFKVIQEGLPDNAPTHRETWPPVGAGSTITDDERLAERVREVVQSGGSRPVRPPEAPARSPADERPPPESPSTTTTVWPQPVHRELGDG